MYIDFDWLSVHAQLYREKNETLMWKKKGREKEDCFTLATNIEKHLFETPVSKWHIYKTETENTSFHFTFPLNDTHPFFHQASSFFCVEEEDEYTQYALYVPLNEHHACLSTIGLFPLTDSESFFRHVSSLFVETNKQTGEQYFFLQPTQLIRNEDSPSIERAKKIYQLEIIFMKQLIKWNKYRFFVLEKNTHVQEEMHWFQNWNYLQSLVFYKKRTFSHYQLFDKWKSFSSFMYQVSKFSTSHTDTGKHVSLLPKNDNLDIQPHTCSFASYTVYATDYVFDYRRYVENESEDPMFSDATEKWKEEKQMRIVSAMTPENKTHTSSSLPSSPMAFQQNNDEKKNKYSNELFMINGEKKTLKEWAKETNISLATLITRVKAGKRGDDLLAPPLKRGNYNRRSKKTS